MPFMCEPGPKSRRIELSKSDISPIKRAVDREKESSLISEKYYSMQDDCLNLITKDEPLIQEVTEFLQQLPSINSFERNNQKLAHLELRLSKSTFTVPEKYAEHLEGYKLKLLNYYKFYKQLKENSQTYSCQYKLRFFGTIENDRIEGYGQMLLEGSYFYEGEIKENMPHGYGVFFYSPELVYYGEFANGRREGRGILELRGEKT